MKFEVTILGSNAATFAYDRHMTAQVINHNSRVFMIDCAEGTQMQIARMKVKTGKLDAIFISHLHGDHHYGLIGFLSSLHLKGRTAPLDLYGPRGLGEIIRVTFRHTKTMLNFPLNFHPVDPEKFQVIYENPFLEVYSVPLDHRIACAGFLFKEKPKPRKILANKLPENFPYTHMKDLQMGKDVEVDGQLYANRELTADPKPALSYAFCSDTRYNERIIPWIREVDMLYHEATFLAAETALADKTYHSTTKQAAQIAKLAQVKKLLIGHFSARYEDLAPSLAESKEVFEESYLAEEGKSFRLDEA